MLLIFNMESFIHRFLIFLHFLLVRIYKRRQFSCSLVSSFNLHLCRQQPHPDRVLEWQWQWQWQDAHLQQNCNIQKRIYWESCKVAAIWKYEDTTTMRTTTTNLSRNGIERGREEEVEEEGRKKKTLSLNHPPSVHHMDKRTSIGNGCWTFDAFKSKQRRYPNIIRLFD